MLSLKPQDIAVLLKIVAIKGRWTVAGLARDIYLSPSETHAALSRAEQAKLLDGGSRCVRLEGLEEFMLHGLQYVYLAVKGELTRGMPTSIAAPPLVGKHFDEPDIPPVWPHPMGLKRGYSLEPLYKKAPDAAAADNDFYELLALTDALREGTSRIRSVATSELKSRFAAYAHYIGGLK
jgi:hypothetical protein